MIDASVILTFDGTIIAGLFVFYAFLVAVVERFERIGQGTSISVAIGWLASAQAVFAVSAILALTEFAEGALLMSIIGLVLLIIYFVIMVVDRASYDKPSDTRKELFPKREIL